MAVTNKNLRMIDRPIWEQLVPAPVTTAVASCIVDDGERFIYAIFTATSFYRYDTWADTWQQLASPPSGTLAAGSCMRYIKEIGTQLNGEVFGSVYAFIASGSAVVFYRYDIATNVWSAALSVVSIPAAFGTDGRISCPEPLLNGYVGGYHGTTSLATITTSAIANIGATSISVTALGLALPSGAVLNFGTLAAPIYAVLTAAAAAAATSITVSALVAVIPSASAALYYADMYLIGNNSTVFYRYNIAANAWTTTSSNSGNPALPGVTTAPGAGCILAWLPGSGDTNALNRFILIRGVGSSTIYEYDLVANVWSTVTSYPATDTFNTGSSSGIRVDSNGKAYALLIQKDATGRIFEFTRKNSRMTPKATQALLAPGAALVGDKTTVIKSPDGIEFLYTLLNTSFYFLRTGLFF